MEKTGLEDFYFFSFLKNEDLIRLKEINVNILAHRLYKIKFHLY